MTLMTGALKAIPQNQFRNCFEGWTRRWHRCIASQGGTMKATTVVFNNEVCSTFTARSSRTLLSIHVCMYLRTYVCMYVCM